MNPTDITNEKRLSNYLRMDLDQLRMLIDNDYVINDNCSKKVILKLGYNILDINKFCLRKKRNKTEYRIIHEPMSESLKNCLKILNSNLNKVYNPPSSANGFIKGRGIKRNAERHLSKKYILGVDIKDFFETITQDMVIKILIKNGFIENIAILISKIVTVEGYLVQGFHTSPTLANMVFKDLDSIFENLDEELVYTRYADDLTFSSDSKINSLPQIREIIKNSGFELNEEKTKLMIRGQNQYVTGLTVFDNQYPRIAKRIKRNIRLEAHYINKFGLREHTLRKMNIGWEEFFNNSDVRKTVENMENYIHDNIYGWLIFINGIESEFSKKYFELLRTRKID